MKRTKKISVELPWIPGEILRGNSRAHWRSKSKAVREARAMGRREGWRLVSAGIRVLGPIGLRVVVYHAKSIDLDNLLIGYKPIIDGLADSYLIDDDRNIKRMAIELRNSKESKSVITIYALNS